MSGFIKSHFLVVTVDVMDVSSDTQENIQHDIYKLRIDKNGLNISDTVQKMGTLFYSKAIFNYFSKFQRPTRTSPLWQMPRRLRCLPVGVVTGLCRKEGEKIFIYLSMICILCF